MAAQAAEQKRIEDERKAAEEAERQRQEEERQRKKEELKQKIAQGRDGRKGAGWWVAVGILSVATVALTLVALGMLRDIAGYAELNQNAAEISAVCDIV